eukprot:gene3472-2423_t
MLYDKSANLNSLINKSPQHWAIKTNNHTRESHINIQTIKHQKQQNSANPNCKLNSVTHTTSKHPQPGSLIDKEAIKVPQVKHTINKDSTQLTLHYLAKNELTKQPSMPLCKAQLVKLCTKTLI